MKKDFLIHQTVHGYSEGHRLLAASYQLSEKEQRTLLGLSDRSGDIVEGFDEYLTGYPLPESNFYALAKTWHAPEMDRPGCVWTHTLLVVKDYFQDLTNTHPLRSLFVRPQKGKQFSIYTEPLTYLSESKSEDAFIFPEPVAEDITDFKTLYNIVFKQLYEKVKGVVLLAEDAYKYEDFILSLWCQQWPKLRSRFTFCTGSMSGRNLQKRPFTLQVTPYQNYSMLVHKYPNLMFIDTRLSEIVKPGVGDYRTFRQKHDPLIQFVWHYGAQVDPLRKNFGWLARFYSLTHEPRNKDIQIPKITEYLASKFPSLKEMPAMKASLYGGNITSETYVTPLGDEESLLTELFTTKFDSIFDPNKLNIYNRTIKLWKDSPQAVLRIAGTYSSKMKMNSIRREFIRATAQFLYPKQAYELFGDNESIMLTLIDYNPDLAAAPELWVESNQVRADVFKSLSKLALQDLQAKAINWRKIVYAILEANTDDFCVQLYGILGEELVTFILDWHSQTESNQSLGQCWLNYLGRHPLILVDWVVHESHAPQTKALAATFLSPHSSNVLDHGSAPWLDLAEHGVEHVPRKDLVPVTGFLLALGFMNTDEDSYKLVVSSFQPVYEAALKDSLPKHVWAYLERLAPSETIIFDWDKCRRLEEALISKIIKNRWHDELLLSTARDPKVFWNVLKSAKASSRGRKLLWRLYEKVKDGSAGATEEQRNILEDFLL